MRERGDSMCASAALVSCYCPLKPNRLWVKVRSAAVQRGFDRRHPTSGNSPNFTAETCGRIPMLPIFFFSIVTSLSPVCDDALLKQLDADFASLVKTDPNAEQLRSAARQ